MKSKLLVFFVFVFFFPTVLFSEDIFEAAKNGDTNFILKYIKNGGDINIGDEAFGRTALMFAAQNGEFYAAKMLIDAKADVDRKSGTDWSALMFAAHFGRKEIVKLLIDAHADLNAVAIDHPPSSTIMIAAMSGQKEIVSMLKEAGAEMDVFTAATIGDTDFIKNFIKEGGNVNILCYPEPGGRTPLLYAAEYDREDVVKLLIGAKALVNFMDGCGWNSLKKAAHYGHTNIVGLLKRSGAKDFSVNYTDSDIFSAACYGRVDFINSYIKSGGNINTRNSDGQTPLMLAALSNPFAVKILIKAGADLNLKDNEGWTAVMSPSVTGNMEALELLVEAGAGVNARDKYGWTALMRASENNHTEMVKFLIGKHADIRAKNINGDTALTRAEFFGHGNAAEILKQAGN